MMAESHKYSIEKSDQQIESIVSDYKKYRNFLFESMVEKDSSDMYLSCHEPPAFRIYEQVYKMNRLPEFDEDQLEKIAYSLMNENQKKKFEENMTCDLGWSHNGRRYRINISRQQKSIMIVARLLEEKVPTLEELDMPKIFKDIIKTESGIILFA